MSYSEYTPINCSYYDELEAYATLKKKVKIIFSRDGRNQELEDIIINLETKNGEEFLHTKSGTKLRLDTLISVDGKAVKYYC